MPHADMLHIHFRDRAQEGPHHQVASSRLAITHHVYAKEWLTRLPVVSMSLTTSVGTDNAYCPWSGGPTTELPVGGCVIPNTQSPKETGAHVLISAS